VGTGVNAGGGGGDGSTGILPVVGVVTASSGDGTGVGDDNFFGDGAGDPFDFFFADDAFPFFFFAGVGVFFALGFFFLGEAFDFGLGDLWGVGDVSASAFSSDETCAEAGVTARTLAINSHKQERATAHVTKENLRRAEAPERNFPARAHDAESRSVFRPAIATDRSDTSKSGE